LESVHTSYAGLAFGHWGMAPDSVQYLEMR